MHQATIFLVAGLAAVANAFWRMECPHQVGVARLDPIVNPGGLSAHLHTVYGSSGFSANSGTADLLSGNCTSCRVTQDKSAYWAPTMHFQDADTHEFEIVNPVGGLLAYYLLYGETVTAFPTNFRMLSGDNLRRSYTLGDPSQPDPEKSIWAALNQTSQADLAQRAIGFNCLNYAAPPEGTLYRHYMPTKDYIDNHCQNGLRLEIMFPSCWKGGDAIDSPNHKDHVAFPDLVMTGTCPPDYPVRLPSLLYEIIFDTPAFKNRNGRFVLSNGDITGFGLHGDFIMGWDRDFLQEAINTCTNDSGRIEDCPLFHIVDQNQAAQCQLESIPPILQKENIAGPCAELPGNVRITGSGDESLGPASGQPGEGAFSVQLPTLSYRPGETVKPSEAPVPGKILDLNLSVGPAAPKSTTSVTQALNSTTSHSTKPTKSMKPTKPTATKTTLTTLSTSSSGSSSGLHAAWLAPVTTTVMVQVVPTPESESFMSTQYVTKGSVVNEILWKEEAVTVTERECTTTVRIADAATTHHSSDAEKPGAEGKLQARDSLHGHGYGHRHRHGHRRV